MINWDIQPSSDKEYVLFEKWKNNISYFVNALFVSYYCRTWKECSGIVVKYELLIHQKKVYNKRTDSVKTKNVIPMYSDFLKALKDIGIGRYDMNRKEWMSYDLVFSEMEILDILNRARVLETYPKQYIDWVDEHSGVNI